LKVGATRCVNFSFGKQGGFWNKIKGVGKNGREGGN
jgi:hypothetical protein